MSASVSSKKSTSTTIKPVDFVHLHNHTHHSLLDGLQKIKPMVQRVKELGMNSVAVTDHGTLSGTIDFYKAAQDIGVKPIIGIEAYVANRKHTDKDPQKDRSRYHMLLFAMNNIGYRNLMKLSSIANLDGYYYKPRIDRDLLKKYNEGIIATSGCIGGEIGEMFRYDQDDKAEEAARWYLEVFGDRFYFEIQDHGLEWDEQKKVNDKVMALADKLNAPLVLTGDAHYRLKEDQDAHEILLCVQTGSNLDDPDRFSLKDTDLHLKDPKEIIERWGELRPDAITNTAKLAERCDVTIKLGDILIPKFDVPKGFSEKSYLHQKTYQGLAWRYAGVEKTKAATLKTAEAKKLLEPKILERAEYELGIIGNMGFDGYFLIVADFIYWGKDQGIVFGPGRGSAAGSIVAYGMEITDLDPIKYDLLFERFLNPDRISMPDIDIDIQDNRRDEVIQYCVDKYGQDRVAHIVTFGKMAARNAIRDVARVLNIPYAEADRIAKMVPPPIQGRHIPLEVSIKDDPSLKAEYETNQQSKRIIDLAIRLEGTIRSHGVHAAGVVIAPDEITNYTPLEMAQKGVVTTQYPMNPVEELGLLKMDFLGLSNLTIINNALRIIRKVYNTDIDISTLELDDIKTYELLGNGMTTGVFQLESAGMKRYLKQLKPTVFDDIIAMAALYRPGPLTAGLTDSFVKRKNGKEKVSFPHEKMKETLGNTFGVLVYQEQVMEISKNVCGFTGGEADTLRKAIGKKKRDVMEKMKVKFIDGGVDHGGVDRSIMVKFWDDLMGFADYAFNKSHSACYALIAYQTAYLKAHYPAAFMAALMTSDFDDTDRLSIEISECKKLGLEVVAPDVNESFVEFAVVPNSKKIRYGMSAIKNVGRGAVEEILRARQDGKFSSIEDFASRVSPRIVNKKAWESLIKAGAFDELEPSRGKLLLNMETILSFSQKLHKEALSGQEDLFGGSLAPEINPVLQLDAPASDVAESEKLQWEKELLGIYLSSHPLDPFEKYLDEQTMPLGQLNEGHDNKSASVGGVLTTVREITTKKGSKMAFVGLEDKTGSIELVVFPGAYEGNEEIWQPDTVIHAQGKFNAKDRNGNISELKVLVDEVIELDKATADAYTATGKKKRLPKATPIKDDQIETMPAKKVFIKLTNPDNSDEELKQLRGLVGDYKGQNEIIVVIDRDSRQAVRLPFKVDADSDDFLQQLVSLFGAANVIAK
ncbi:TPA: DNA polymerase III subunit alpha [Candidatus Saccharibacteria bacterium]|nr:DNA polymerase III subunit alpha [Candidatus Saccharibacteria bacterium]HIO87442.1 DNA polymerase III subunit alpha [Candidatus Saccharibacteria bacterium]